MHNATIVTSANSHNEGRPTWLLFLRTDHPSPDGTPGAFLQHVYRGRKKPPHGRRCTIDGGAVNWGVFRYGYVGLPEPVPEPHLAYSR